MKLTLHQNGDITFEGELTSEVVDLINRIERSNKIIINAPTYPTRWPYRPYDVWCGQVSAADTSVKVIN